MIFLKIYLLGCLLSFIIESITYLRIKQFTSLDLGFMFSIAIPFSWLYVFLFVSWIIHTMGLQYEDIEKKLPYSSFIAWRLRR